MSEFWLLSHPGNDMAVVDEAGGFSLTYRELADHVALMQEQLPHGAKTLGFVFCRNNTASLTGYLAALREGHAVTLLDTSLEASLLGELFDSYRPEWLWMPEEHAAPPVYRQQWQGFGNRLYFRDTPADRSPIHPDLALVLSTSGTTGSPKTVRLSYGNLQFNADAIAALLEISQDERPITTLPMHYSYGLSVINSHLASGATLLMTDHGILSREFWNFLKGAEATSIAGVPYTYQMLHRLRFATMDLPSLRTMTQAGGRLDVNLQRYFAEEAEQKHIRFFIMYGQTEATARISYLPWQSTHEGIGSIGIPIPGGRMEIDDETGELIYYGPNIMMGYAETREDLAKGDELHGRLATGDLARRDEKGFFHITGRLKRFLKLFGLRINLDDVERFLEKECGIHSICVGDDTRLVVVVPSAADFSRIKETLVESYHLHPTAFRVVADDALPRLPSGKIDYQALNQRYTA